MYTEQNQKLPQGLLNNLIRFICCFEFMWWFNISNIYAQFKFTVQ